MERLTNVFLADSYHRRNQKITKKSLFESTFDCTSFIEIIFMFMNIFYKYKTDHLIDMVRYSLFHMIRYLSFHMIRYSSFHMIRYSSFHMTRYLLFHMIRCSSFHMTRYLLFHMTRYSSFHMIRYQFMLILEIHWRQILSSWV